jgi:hypothetical protein
MCIAFTWDAAPVHTALTPGCIQRSKITYHIHTALTPGRIRSHGLDRALTIETKTLFVFQAPARFPVFHGIPNIFLVLQR